MGGWVGGDVSDYPKCLLVVLSFLSAALNSDRGHRHSDTHHLSLSLFLPSPPTHPPKPSLSPFLSHPPKGGGRISLAPFPSSLSPPTHPPKKTKHLFNYTRLQRSYPTLHRGEGGSFCVLLFLFTRSFYSLLFPASCALLGFIAAAAAAAAVWSIRVVSQILLFDFKECPKNALYQRPSRLFPNISSVPFSLLVGWSSRPPLPHRERGSTPYLSLSSYPRPLFFSASVQSASHSHI